MKEWPEVLAGALIGTARTGDHADELLDTAAAHALRRRAGVPLVGPTPLPEPAPDDDAPIVSPAAAVRADALLALDLPARGALPVRETGARLELLAEWLGAAARGGRRLPPELVPALLDAGRRHHGLRPLIPAVAGPLAGWLAAQRPDWRYAAGAAPTASTAPTASDVDDREVWELGALPRRVGYLTRLRRTDPGRAGDLLAAGWDAEAPDDRAALLAVLRVGLAPADEPLLERALDDRRKQVRDIALDLLPRLPDSAYAKRMARRAHSCLDLSAPRRIGVRPPAGCDRAMRRDGVAPRPPAGTGERAWWLEEILARTPLRLWPEPAEFLARRVGDGWVGTLRRGLARAAAAQQHRAWSAALVDALTEAVVAHDRPEDRLLLEALYEALPPIELAARAAAALRHGLASATTLGVERVLALCPGPWPPAVAESVVAAIEDELRYRGSGWRIAGLSELAALRLPADLAPRAADLAERLRTTRPNDPGRAALDRLAATLKFRRDMLEEVTR